MNNFKEDNLFDDNLPECHTNEELKKLQAEHPELDSYYIASSVFSERKVLFQECYRTFKPYKDTNFLRELKTKFHQRSWEMYLGTLFITNGKKLNPNRADNLPDLQIINKINFIHIECTAVTHGDPIRNPDAVLQMYIAEDVYHLILQDVPEEKILLRITQALEEKTNQYKRRISDKRVDGNDPYIIAINTGELGHPEHLPRILKAVFGIGYRALRMRQNGLPVSNPSSFWTRREAIPKENKIDIDMTFFEKEENKGISAIIYSNSNVLHYLTNPAETDIIMVHNPLAVNRILNDQFNFWPQYYIDKTSGEMVRIEPTRTKE